MRVFRSVFWDIFDCGTLSEMLTGPAYTNAKSAKRNRKISVWYITLLLTPLRRVLL
jgi:hypothetical protein